MFGFGADRFLKVRNDVAQVLQEVIGALIESIKIANKRFDDRITDLAIRHDSTKLELQDHLNRIATLEGQLKKLTKKTQEQ